MSLALKVFWLPLQFRNQFIMKILHTAFALTFVALLLAGCVKDDNSNPIADIEITVETNENGEVDLTPEAVIIRQGKTAFRIHVPILIGCDRTLDVSNMEFSMILNCADGELEIPLLQIKVMAGASRQRISCTAEFSLDEYEQAKNAPSFYIAYFAAGMLTGKNVSGKITTVQPISDDECVVQDMNDNIHFTDAAIDKANAGKVVCSDIRANDRTWTTIFGVADRIEIDEKSVQQVMQIDTTVILTTKITRDATNVFEFESDGKLYRAAVFPKVGGQPLL